MAVSPARAAAFEILLKVDREHSYASELLHSPRFAKLSSADHGLVTELVMGVLRWRSLLDRRIARVSSQKLEQLDDEVVAALRLGVYQLQFLSRIPARAAIFESVELVKAARKRSAASFANAVLRKVARETTDAAMCRAGILARQLRSTTEQFKQILASSDSTVLARHAAHPAWLVERWVERFGLEAARQICAYNQQIPATAIHASDEKSLEDLAEDGIQLSGGRLLSAARWVQTGDVTKTRAFREGRISIQDEASQLVGTLVGRGKTILDCCAAPGGKTALIAARNPTSTIFATELHPHRARLLRSLARQSNVYVIAADARQLPLSTRFDRILADVPCSGTGTLARNPEIKWRLKPEDLADLQSRQIAILTSALSLLVTGGHLVYSTCSLESEENEAAVEAALRGASGLEIVDYRDELHQLLRSGELSAVDVESLIAGPYLRTIPGVHPCDGFFAAIIARTGSP